MDTRQMKEKSLWNRLAKQYDRQVSGYDQAYKRSIQKVLQHINSTSSVLEIACGTGIISFGIAANVKKLIAVDLSEQMIAIARQKAQERGIHNLDFQVADGYALQYAEASFDAILLFNVLHVVKEPDTLLREVRRLLRPDGVILTATDCYAEPAPLGIRVQLVVQKLLKACGVIPYLCYYTKAGLEATIRRNGFEVIETDIVHQAPVNYYVAAHKSGAQ